MKALVLLACASIAWSESAFWSGFWSEAKSLSFPSGSRKFPSPAKDLKTTYATLLFDADDLRLGLVRTLVSSMRSAENNPALDFVVFSTEALTNKQLNVLAEDNIMVRNVAALDLPWKLGESGTLVDIRTGFVSEHAPVPGFHRNWRLVFTKLQLFGAVEFEQLVVLDYDILVQESLTTKMLPLCSSSAHLCMLQESSGYGNGGVIVIRPSQVRHADLLEAFEGLKHSGLVLKYAEQDFWNIYAAQDNQFLTLMPLPNNCPGNCGNFLAPFPSDCYLTQPELFPILHFCGAAKPSLCTRSDMDAIWGDFCASQAAQKWTSLFYRLDNPCGEDQGCTKTPRQRQRTVEFDLTTRVRHRAELLVYTGPTGGCCSESLCVPSDYPQDNCTSGGGTWNASGVDCLNCGVSLEQMPILHTSDLNNSGLTGALALSFVDVAALPPLPAAAAGATVVLSFQLTLIVGGEVSEGGQLAEGKYIEILLSSSTFNASQTLVVYRFDVPSDTLVDSKTDCNAETARDPVFVDGDPPSFLCRLCHLSDFQVASLPATNNTNGTEDGEDEKPSKKKGVTKKPRTKVPEKPSKAKGKAKIPEVKDPKKKAAPKEVKDPKAKAAGPAPKKGKLSTSLGVGLGVAVGGGSALAAGLALWAFKRRKAPRKNAAATAHGWQSSVTVRV